MKDSDTKRRANAMGLTVVSNDAYVDPVETAAKAFCDKLEAEYPRCKAPAGDIADIIIDLPDDDKVIERAVRIMEMDRNWNIDIVEYTATSGRCGSVRLTPSGRRRS